MEFQIFRMKPVCIGTMTTYLKCKKLCNLQSQILEDINDIMTYNLPPYCEKRNA